MLETDRASVDDNASYSSPLALLAMCEASVVGVARWPALKPDDALVESNAVSQSRGDSLTVVASMGVHGRSLLLSAYWQKADQATSHPMVHIRSLQTSNE